MKKGVDPEGIPFNLPKLRCKECGYTWYARKTGEITNCPSCRSTNWNFGRNIHVTVPVVQCPKCEYIWSPRNMILNECPECKKKLFNTIGIKTIKE